ncbi:MAG: phenylacetate--CoA ligase family protein [Victivallaceae bacterium]|nr:hypothetical protein [Victivallaceae bacterium]
MKSHIFLLKNALLRNSAFRFYKQFRLESEMSDDERQALRFLRLKRILTQAYNFSPYYHDKYRRAGMCPDDIRQLDDFEKVPTLTKDEVREHGNDIICKNQKMGDMRLSTTGGSTGEPIKVYHDRRVPIDVISWWILKEWGLDISDNMGFIYRYRPAHSFLNALSWFPTGRIFLDASFIDDSSCEHFYCEARKKRIKCICGYVGAVQQFGYYLRKKNYSIPSLKAVWTTAAPLPSVLRMDMESIFHAPVFSQYGCCEIFGLATECPKKNGLHWFDTIREIEVVDKNKRALSCGEYGETLITDLLNECFPLIRYQNGDNACKMSHKCDCGCRFPLLAPIRGRVTDMIKFRDGSYIAGDFLTTIFDATPDAVLAFCVIQRADYSLLIKYVPAGSSSAQTVQDVCASLRNRFAAQKLDVTQEEVSGIAHDRGKTRFIISEVAE